jgi:hypothetical protein
MGKMMMSLLALCLLSGCITTASDLGLPLGPRQSDAGLVADGESVDNRAEARASMCETPLRMERARCPAVHEKRVWVSDDGDDVACRLSVCGEDRVWRRSGGRWQESTLRLR